MSRQATVIVSDELTSSLTGKLHILGAYTGDIIIAADPTSVGQLVFLFIMESDPDDPFKKIELRVELPGGSSTGIQIPVQLFMPYFFASLKVAVTQAFVGTVIAETVASNRGIGNLMMIASSSFDVPLVFAGLLVLAVLGVALYVIFSFIENRVTGWAHRKDEFAMG